MSCPVLSCPVLSCPVMSSHGLSTFFSSLTLSLCLSLSLSFRSRNYIAWKEGVWSDTMMDENKYPKEDCPHCANIGGTAGQCGIIGSTNYLENRNVHGDFLPANPQAIYTQGQTILVTVVLTAHHMGHFEFKACPIDSSLSSSSSSSCSSG
jgi:hypothetical protein